MPYGKIKVDTLTYDNSGSDVDIVISSIPSSATLAAKANLASPTFTGVPAAPTAAADTNTTQIATTAYVVGQGYLKSATASNTYLATGAIGTTVQAYDANTAKTNVAQSFTKAQRGAVVALTSGATITPDFAAGQNFSLSLGINAFLANPTNLTAGQSGVIVITNGAYTLAFDSFWKFPGGTAPSLTQNGTDALAYYVDSSTRITARLVADVR